MNVKEKKFLVVGAGKSGIAAAELLKKEQIAVTLYDGNENLDTAAFYEKNPDLYETAFAIYEESQMNNEEDGNIAAAFHEEYNRLYREFLLAMFDGVFG